MLKKYKTKFPVARIKKIMRTDEEVGKVAQVTPVLISKALELFMADIVTETCKITQSKSAKKVTKAHLRKTILEVPRFDFLADFVGEEGGEEEKEEEEGKPKRRRKKTEKTVKDEDEEDE